MSSAPAFSASSWTVEETSQWLRNNGFEEQIQAFADNDIDGSALLELTQEELKDDLKIGSLGKRKAIIREIEKLKPPESSREVLSVQESPKTDHQARNGTARCQFHVSTEASSCFYFINAVYRC